MENEKINRYLSQAYDCYFEKDFTSCKDYVLRVLNFQPDNADALALRMLLNYHKGSNGRYQPTIKQDQFFSVLKKGIENGLCENSHEKFVILVDHSLNNYYNNLIDLSRRDARYGFSSEPKSFANYLKNGIEEALSLLNGKNNVNTVTDILIKQLNAIIEFLEAFRIKENKWIEDRIEDEEKERSHKNRKIVYAVLISIVLVAFIAFAAFMSKKGSQLAIIGWIGMLLGGIGLGLLIKQY